MAPSNFWIEEANEAEMVEPVSWECVELTPPLQKNSLLQTIRHITNKYLSIPSDTQFKSSLQSNCWQSLPMNGLPGSPQRRWDKTLPAPNRGGWFSFFFFPELWHKMLGKL
jgi:hypothetical protein